MTSTEIVSDPGVAGATYKTTLPFPWIDPRCAAQLKARFWAEVEIDCKETLMVELPPTSTTPGSAVKRPEVIGEWVDRVKLLSSSPPQPPSRRDNPRPDAITR